MSDPVLRVAGLKVAYGGRRASRSARKGGPLARPLPVPPPTGGGSAQRESVA
jgi:hypothetical protein